MNRKIAYLLVALALMAVGARAAEGYRIGPGDLLEIRFWQDATLNVDVRVGQDGMINLDIIGQVQAAGKTTTELQNDIVRQMSRLNTRISQAVVRVIEYQYQYVFVKGQVLNPGKLTFEEIPDLWTIINEAGGISDIGDLTRVTIIRGGRDAGKVEVVNVIEAIESGRLDQLPQIRREDTIEIPRTPAGIPSADISQQVTRKNVIYVIGAVTTPGPISFQEDVDVMEALALAGGPVLEADLKKARVVTKDGYYAQTIQVDLDKYSKTGSPPRYILQKEDTFIVPYRREGFLGIGLPTAATILGIITSAVIIYEVVTAEGGGGGAAPAPGAG
ncbi:MAG: polysaccharide biosynthesis/export family protein [Candidatus Zixiibacteriota bacterium]|nr:MAG: polysaccharide biosynthesis/export family protein [candidate division Zixibacteria bacterium]